MCSKISSSRRYEGKVLKRVRPLTKTISIITEKSKLKNALTIYRKGVESNWIFMVFSSPIISSLSPALVK